MTLKKMCEMAATFTDRRDDFETVTNPDTGEEWYDPEDDAGIWFENMKMSINSAYQEAARRLLMPDIRTEMELGEGGTLDLDSLSPGITQVKAVFNADGSVNLEYDFVTKFQIRVRDRKAGDTVLLQYYYVPDALEELRDEPIFPESLVAPMVYVALAAANLWAADGKLQKASYWQNMYYKEMNDIRANVRSARDRRIRRRPFR